MRVVLGCVVAWLVVILSLRALGFPQRVAVPSVARYVAAEAFMVAGLFRLLCWHWTRDRASLRAAGALCTMGVGLPVLAAIAPWTIDGVHVEPNAALGRAVLLAAVFVILDVRRAQLSRRANVVALCLVAAAASAALTGDDVAAGLTEAVTVAGWFALSSARALNRCGTIADCSGVTTTAMAVMAAAEAFRLAGVVRPGALLGIAPGLEVAAAVLVAGAAVIDLHATVRLERGRTGRLCSELTLLRSTLDGMRDVEHERLHDVRSAVAGVRGASTLLARGTSLAQPDRERLQDMIDSELGRLATTLETDSTETCAQFDLAAALGPVVQANRLDSTRISASIGTDAAWGRPKATATALDNVLRNARAHAPGAAVDVRVRRRGDALDIVVDDNGPGIPVHERRLVQRRGVRGSTVHAPGSGLGLHIVATTMIAQGGALELSESPSGGLRVVLTVRAALADAHRVAV